MHWYNRKTRRNAFRLAGLVLLLAGTYFLYSYYQKANLADYEMQNSYTGTKRPDTVPPSETRILVASLPPADTVKAVAAPDSSSYTRLQPLYKQKDSVAGKWTAAQPNKPAGTGVKEADYTGALSGPGTVFSHTCTIGVGKTVSVNVVWTENGVKTSRYRLITIKADNIADNKAWLTIEDPFAVLLFSQAGYGVNDKVVINDDRHNLDIRVMQVSAGSVVVDITSHLNDALVSKLQKMP